MVSQTEEQISFSVLIKVLYITTVMEPKSILKMSLWKLSALNLPQLSVVDSHLDFSNEISTCVCIYSCYVMWFNSCLEFQVIKNQECIASQKTLLTSKWSVFWSVCRHAQLTPLADPHNGNLAMCVGQRSQELQPYKPYKLKTQEPQHLHLWDLVP